MQEKELLELLRKKNTIINRTKVLSILKIYPIQKALITTNEVFRGNFKGIPPKALIEIYKVLGVYRSESKIIIGRNFVERMG